MFKQFEIITPKSVVKELSKIPLPWREKILDAMSILKNNPLMGEKMMGKLSDKRKIRIWPYRIIYRIDNKNKQILITDVGHRQGVYNK